jgi:WD40 repeat protein/tRNA A-37 threonylcarbamoyl transferase component Bud32
MPECPPREVLERLLAETLDDDNRASIETHVEVCADCQNVLSDLTRGVAGHLSELPSIRPNGAGLDLQPEAEAFFQRLKRMTPPTGGDHGAQSSGLPEKENVLPEVEGYEIEQEIGRGATGVVYRARHRKLNRLVALKVVAAGAHLSPAARQRFQIEAHAVARLKHVNIVQVYDVGEYGDFPYLSLELVAGGNLAEWMGGKPRPAVEAAQLVATLARTVDYAHRQGVVHRDLKPSNVLLGEVPDRPGQRDLKITDFGIAKLRAQTGVSDAPMTQTGEILGTPAYMAPEQARGNAGHITPSADVYSLGAILYELLTGRPPFQGATPLDTLMQAARQDAVPTRLLVHGVPQDLDTICMKCLEKEAGRRYQTAGELAADVGRYLAGEPILARPLSWFGHSVRWVRRHRGVAASLMGVALSLLLLALVSLVVMAHFRTLEHQQRLLTRQKEVERNNAQAAGAEAQRAGAEARRDREAMRGNLYLSEMNLGGQAARELSGIGRVRDRLTPWGNVQPDLRKWEWYYLNGICNRDLFTLRTHLQAALCVAWSPDGRQLASAGADGIVAIWDATDGRELFHLAGHSQVVSAVVWSPDGRRLATASEDHTVRTWDARTGATLLTIQASTAELYEVTWSPDGTRLAAGGNEGTVGVWNADTGANIYVLRGHKNAVFDVEWSPDGSNIASGGADAVIRLWDPANGKERAFFGGHRNWIKALAWNQDGTRLASASNDATIKIWGLNPRKELATLTGHLEGIRSVAWSPDGTRLASSGDDQSIKIWRADGGPELDTMRGHTAGISSVAWSPDGRRLASASDDKTVKIWDAAAAPESLKLAGHTGPISALAWAGDSRHLASASYDNMVKVWDVRLRREQFTLHGHSDWLRTAAWSPDGRWLASAGADQTIRIWDAANAVESKTLRGHTADIYSVAWGPDSRLLASAGDDGSIRIWDAIGGTAIRTCQGHEPPLRSVAWRPDGQLIASGCVDGTVKIWSAANGVAILTLRAHVLPVNAVAWSPDGQSLAAASEDQTITVSIAPLGKLSLVLRGHAARVDAVAWSPTGDRLVSGSEDGTVKIWDAISGKEALTLDGPGQVYAVAWSPDGSRVACGGTDYKVLIYDATPGYAAALAPSYLAVLDQQIASNPTDATNWRTRAQIHAGMKDWGSAEADAQHYLALRPVEHWCTLGYWVAGPYPEDLNAHFPPEASPDPGKPVPEEKTVEPSPTFLNWQRVPLNPAGFVNFGELFGNAEHISGYALLKIYSPTRQKVAILLGADDQVRLWLKDKQIYENLAQRAAFPDTGAVTATLDSGWNTLLARVVNVTGSHALYLRLSDAPTDLARTR